LVYYPRDENNPTGHLATAYSNNQYGQPCKTLRGEWVKSHGEKQIADYFFSNGIKYVYEDQAKTTKSAFRNGISKPDFYLPDHDVYIEYWGMIDVGDTDQRKKYREDMNWKKKQYYDNRIRFISIFPWHLNDLDGAFKAQYKYVMKRDFVTGPVGLKTVYAVPISPDFTRLVQSRVPVGLPLTTLDLEYTPYYFVEYDCFTQANMWYQRVNLSSKGMLVINGQNGSATDMAIYSGVTPAITRSGHFADCHTITQREIPRNEVAPGLTFNKFDAIQVGVTKYDAERTTSVEVAKNLSQTYSHTYKNGRTDTKTIRPYANEVRIVRTKLLNIPIITATYRYKDKTYRRVIQATTNKIIADGLVFCNVERNPHRGDVILLCEDCGSIACKDHGRRCAVCNRGLCELHAKSKGLVMKKYYCSVHVPQK